MNNIVSNRATDRVLLQQKLNSLMNARGFKKKGTKDFVIYKNDLEHYLYTSFAVKVPHLFTMYYGVRHIASERFAICMLRRHGGRPYAEYKGQGRHQCQIQFPVGILFDWTPRWSLDLSVLNIQEFSDNIQYNISEKLLPILTNLNTLTKYYEFFG